MVMEDTDITDITLIPLDLNVTIRMTNNATKSPKQRLTRSPSISARQLWTPSTSRSVRRSPRHTVKKHTRRDSTPPMLWVMNHMLSENIKMGSIECQMFYFVLFYLINLLI